MSPLAVLVAARVAELGLTWQELQDRGVPGSTLAFHLRGGMLRQTPRPATLERYATVLDLPLPVLVRAAHESVEGWDDTPTVLLDVAALERMPPARRAREITRLRRVLDRLG